MQRINTTSSFTARELCFVRDADLKQYPSIETEHASDDVLVIGDLHANALKLIYLLIKHQRLSLPPLDYARLYDIYEEIGYYLSYLEYHHYHKFYMDYVKKLTPDESAKKQARLEKLKHFVEQKQDNYFNGATLFHAKYGIRLKDSYEYIKHHVHEFKRILKHAKIINHAPILLLGDDVCDRGISDHLILDVYGKLHRNHVPYTTLFSNHGLKCIVSLEKHIPLHKFAYFNPLYKKNMEQYHSFNHMSLLIRSHLLHEEHTLCSMKNYWLNHLKLMDYTISNNTLTLYSHAPIGLKTIRFAAEFFGVPYTVNNLQSITQMIDQINLKFAELRDKDEITKTSDIKHVNIDNGSFIAFIHFLVRMAWNRKAYGSDGDDMPSELNGYFLRYVHGHHQFDFVDVLYQPYTLSLDDEFGKESAFLPTESKTLIVQNDASFFKPKKSEQVYTASKSLSL